MARKKKRGSGKARNVPPEEEPVAALQTEAEANTVEEEVPQNSSGGGEGPIASAEEASASAREGGAGPPAQEAEAEAKPLPASVRPEESREPSSGGVPTPIKIKVKVDRSPPKPSPSRSDSPDKAEAKLAVMENMGYSQTTTAYTGSFTSVGTSGSSPGRDRSINVLNDVGGQEPVKMQANMLSPTTSVLTQSEKVEKRENIRLLEQIPLLKNLHKWEKSKIAEHLQFRDYDEGDVIVLEGDEADEFYIVKDGVVDISVEVGEGMAPKILSTITRRGWFGELALLKDQPRNATARARTKVQCLVLIKDDFIRLIGTLEEVLNRGNVVARHKKATERWHRAFNIISKTLMLLRRIRKEQARKLDWKTLTFGSSKLERAYQVFNQKESTYMGRSAAIFGFGIMFTFFLHDLVSPPCTWTREIFWVATYVLALPFIIVLCVLPELVALKKNKMNVITLATALLWLCLMLPWIVSPAEAAKKGYFFFLARLATIISFAYQFAPLGIVRNTLTVLVIVAMSEILLLQPKMQNYVYEVGGIAYNADSTLSLVNMQAVILLSFVCNYSDHRRKERDHRKAFILAYDIHEEWKSSEAFLHSMLPNKAISALKRGQKLFAEWIENGTIVFVQICDFNRFVENMPPRKLINFLNDIFLQFDSLVDKHNVYKIETVNEYYMAGSGILKNDKYHAVNSAACAVAMLKVCAKLSEKLDGEQVTIKIGMNSGSLIAGVIGLKQINYRVFGDTVNIASRMCANSQPGKVMITKRTATYLKKSRNYKFDVEDLGEKEIKGKGAMQVYYLHDAVESNPLSPSLSIKSTGSIFSDYERKSFEQERKSFEQERTSSLNEDEDMIDISETSSFKSFSRKLLKRVSTSTRRLSRLSFSEFRPLSADREGKRKSLIKAQIDLSQLSHGNDYKPEPSEASFGGSIRGDSPTPSEAPSTPRTPATPMSSHNTPFSGMMGGDELVTPDSSFPGLEGGSVVGTPHPSRMEDDSLRRNSAESSQSVDTDGGEDEGRITLDADNLHSNLTKPVPQRRKSKRKSLVETIFHHERSQDSPDSAKSTPKDIRKTKSMIPSQSKRKSEMRRKSFIEKLYPEMDLSLESINAYKPKKGTKLKSESRDLSSRVPNFTKGATRRGGRKGSIVHDMWKKNANRQAPKETDKVHINKITLDFEGKNAADIEALYQHRKLYELKQNQSSAILGISAVLILKLMMELQFSDLSRTEDREYLLASLLTKVLYFYIVSMIYTHKELKVFREIRMTKNGWLVFSLVLVACIMLFVPSFIGGKHPVMVDALICIFLIHYSFHACIFLTFGVASILIVLVLPAIVLVAISAGTGVRFKAVECTTAGVLILCHTVMLMYAIHSEEFLRKKQYTMRRDLLAQNKVFELLIYNLVPPQIVYKLRRGQTYLVTQHPDASVLFADIKGFTPLTASVPAIVLVGFLNTLFSALDDLCIKEKVYKVNTIGDCYVVAAGVPTRM